MISKKNLRYLKTLSQILLLVFSVYLVAIGLWGDQFAPKNVTTLFVWVHYRGFLVIALLLWGNFFCMSCPFIFLRDAARVFITPKKLWPKKLQNKWTAIFIFITALFCYEYFSLWSSPYITALLILLFFLSALAIDLTFKKASFCKYICPIGQFNFLASTLSPKVIAPIKMSVCESCTTQDCLRGNTQLNLRGCELHLLMPKKKGNLDCTFCMDCVQACPHDNIEITKVIPTAELWDQEHRSGIGKLTARFDLLVFIIVFTFGALINALMMVGPGHDLREQFTMPVLFIFFIIILPVLLLIIPEGISRKFERTQFTLIPSLLPVGFSIWLAHYSFHLLSGFFTFIPILFKITIPISWMGLSPSIVFPIQLGILALGFMGSSIITSVVAKNHFTKTAWITTHALIIIFAFWIFSLPMEMRGTFIGMNP